MRHSIATAIAAPLLVLAAAPSLASQTTLTFQHGMNGYAGTADTYLRASEPDTVFGGESEVSIDASDGGMPSQTLLRFDNLFGSGAGQIGADRVIVSATLRLFITSAGSGMRVHEMLVPWTEGTASWTSMGDGIQADGSEATTLPLFELGANDGSANIPEEPLTLDMTLALQRLQAGLASGHGWALLPFMPDGTNGLDFASREWAELGDRPLLSVVTAPVPEPATVASMLAGLALLGALAKRRRG